VAAISPTERGAVLTWHRLTLNGLSLLASARAP